MWLTNAVFVVGGLALLVDALDKWNRTRPLPEDPYCSCGRVAGHLGKCP